MAIHIRRRELIATLGGIVAAWPAAVCAQQAHPIRRIGVLMGLAESDPQGQSEIDTFRRRLQALGMTGRNVRIAYRWAAGEVDQLRAFARELIALQPDAIFAVTTPAVAALVDETRTIPIVFVRVSDPLAFVDGLAHPGGNITGFSNFEASLAGKWVQLLKEAAPRVTHATLLFNPATAPRSGSEFLRLAEAAAPSMGLEVKAAPVTDIDQIEDVFAAVGRDANGGIINLPDVFLVVHRDITIELAARYRVPTIYQYRYFATNGGLMSYGTDVMEQYATAAGYLDRILKGAKLAELPVQNPTKYEFVVNLRTAKALGLDMPQTLLARADEVIE
jgi:putative tryptophan/tyrosine transport system substrate-binding protein